MLHRMLPRLPADLDASIAIVQHMPPGFIASLAHELDHRSPMSVSEAAHGRVISNGQVIIAPGGQQMKLRRLGSQIVVSITDDPPENGCQPSVDYLFRSVAKACHDRAVGVIMTGMGQDGTAGCHALRKRGAKILAQSEESCVVFGMPREPIRQKLVDFVGTPEELAEAIVEAVNSKGRQYSRESRCI